MTMQVTSKIKLQAAYDKIDKERLSAQGSGDDQRVTAIHWTSPNYSTQTGKLTATLTNRLLLEGGWSAAIERYNTYYEDGIEQRYYTPLWYAMVARNNTTDSLYSVAPSNEGRTYPDRYNWQGSASYVTGSHNIKVGFLDSFGTYNRGSYKNGDMITNFQTQGGVPNTAYQAVIYPTDPRDQQRLNAMVSIYAQDSWTHKRVTLTGGFRYDYTNQEVLGSPAMQGTFEVIPAYGNIQMPKQSNWSPRISGVVDVFGNGKTAIRAGFNKVVNSATESLATGQNPGSGNSGTVAWTDVNGDNIAQYQVSPNPTGGGVVSPCVYKTAGCELDFSKLASNFGAIAINNTLDPNLGRPYAKQINVGISQEVMKGVSVTVEWFRTNNKNIQASNNTARVVNGPHRSLDEPELPGVHGLQPGRRPRHHDVRPGVGGGIDRGRDQLHVHGQPADVDLQWHRRRLQRPAAARWAGLRRGDEGADANVRVRLGDRQPEQPALLRQREPRAGVRDPVEDAVQAGGHLPAALVRH